MKATAVLHTTPATIEPIRALLSRKAPDLTVRNYLDDSLLPEINRNGRVTEDVRERFFALARAAELAAPDAMLCACSSVGDLVEDYARVSSRPFLRIDAPMAKEAARRGGRAALLATLPSTLAPTLSLIEREAKAGGSGLSLTSLVIEGAGALLTRGDLAGYDALLGSHFLRLAEENDALVLAQASMARALSGLPEAVRAKFLTSPESGTDALIEVLGTLANQ